MKPNDSEYRGIYKVIHDVKAVTGWSMMTIAKQIRCYMPGVSVRTIEKSLRQGYGRLGHSKYTQGIALAWHVSETMLARGSNRTCKSRFDLKRIYGIDVDEIMDRCEQVMREQNSERSQHSLKLYWRDMRENSSKIGKERDALDKTREETIRKTVKMLRAVDKKKDTPE